MKLTDCATALLGAHDGARCIALPSSQIDHFTLDSAVRVADDLRQRRIARGERPCGYKIGFTNRSIWERYGVFAPIWGPVWDSTLTLLDSPRHSVSLAGLCQPRLEPEIVFGLAHAPRPGMSERELQACVEWVAHGFEIVDTHFEGWRFTAADTMADFALHARLMVGPRVAVRDWPNLGADLAGLHIQLADRGKFVDEGQGTLVLDGPLNALRLWVDEMDLRSPQWPIRPGDVVTTGTLTDAWPLAPGQRWSTRLTEARLAGLELTVE